jgi:hypothetical protein
MKRSLAPVGIVLVFAGLCLAQEPTQQPAESSCVACHGQLEDEMHRPVELWGDDVHAAARVGCEGCHGGDPSPGLADDLDAMAPENGFRSAPDRLAVADFCATCHSNLEFMRKFDPQARVDQLTEYRTSTHGKRNAEGDPVPATCIDCHGAHGVRPVDRPDSPVYAANVPDTCSTCHNDGEKMKPYGLPTDQFALYRRSMHGMALLEREDTAAPACNDCHGNHGAAPPGVASVANVCGQCHGREGMLFGDSFKRELFEDLGVAECSVCHGNHRVLHPTPALFYSGAEPLTSQGKIVSTDPLLVELGPIAAAEPAVVSWTGVLSPHGDTEDGSFGHKIVVQDGSAVILEVDATVLPGSRPSQSSPRSTAVEGLAASLSVVSESGEPVKAGDSLTFRLELVGQAPGDLRVSDRPGKGVFPLAGSICMTCHERGDECDQATERMYEAVVSLDREIREAETLLHRAEVAGMEVSEPLFGLKSGGRTAQIEARALIHAFDPERVIERTQEGREVAVDGLGAARAALEEIQFRRKGLAVSLVLVAIVLIGLLLKIRQIERRRRTA